MSRRLNSWAKTHRKKKEKTHDDHITEQKNECLTRETNA